MKKIIILASSVLMLSSCGEKKWEYKTVQVDGVQDFVYIGDDYNPKRVMPTQQLNKMGEEGWELVTAYPIVETVFPNFGNAEYHTGIKTNTRTKAVQYVFKREKRESLSKSSK